MITAPSLSGETGETCTAVKVHRESVKVSLPWLSLPGKWGITPPGRGLPRRTRTGISPRQTSTADLHGGASQSGKEGISIAGVCKRVRSFL